MNVPHRLSSGYELWLDNKVKQTEDNEFFIETGEKKGHTVTLLEEVYFHCDCPDAQYRDVICKHIIAAMLFLIFGADIEM